MRLVTAMLTALAVASPLFAQDTFKVATLDTPANALNILQFTIPVSGSPTVSVTKSVKLPSGSEYIARTDAGDVLYVSAGSAGQLVAVNPTTGATATTVTIGLPRRLQVTSSTCLTYGASAGVGNPALESSPFPTLAPATVASPATTRFQDLTASRADGLAFLAATRDVSGTEHGELHLLDATACPPTPKAIVNLGASKAAYSIAPAGARKALASLVGTPELFAIDFGTLTATKLAIVNLPPKPRLTRRLDSLPNRHYVIDQDGPVTLLDTSAATPTILANLVVGAATSVALVDPSKQWLVIFDRKPGADAQLYKIITGNTVDPAAAKLVRQPAPVYDAVMIP